MPPPAPPDSAVPHLATHARLRRDSLTARWLLLYPEGILELDETAATVLQLCDGQRSMSEIFRHLAGEFESIAGEIGRDTADFLEGLRRKGLLRFEGPDS